MNKLKAMISLLSCLAATTALADVAGDLAAARAAIKGQDYASASGFLKQALQGAVAGGPDEAQALALVDRIYEKTAGLPIPVDYVIPPSLQGLKVRFLRRLRRPDETPTEAGDHRDSIAIQAPYDLRGRVASLVLKKLPGGTVLLDSSKSDEWGGDIESDTTYLAKDFRDGTRMEGLYELDATLNDQARSTTSAWFIVTRAMPTTDPVISSPRNVPLTLNPPDVPLNPRNLVFGFSDFESTELRSFERRNLLAYLNYHVIVDGQQDISGFWQTEVPNPRLGEFASGKGDLPFLISGEYRFAVNYQELRGFGPFELSREAETVVRFFVALNPVDSCSTLRDQLSCADSMSTISGPGQDACVWGYNGAASCMGMRETGPRRNLHVGFKPLQVHHSRRLVGAKAS